MKLQCHFCDKSFETEHGFTPGNRDSIAEHAAEGAEWRQVHVEIGGRKVFTAFVCPSHVNVQTVTLSLPKK